jgi:putative nucleotide binding protein
MDRNTGNIRRDFSRRPSPERGETDERKQYEEKIVILDYLPQGRGMGRGGNDPIIIGVGSKWFTLLEVTVSPGEQFIPLDEVIIGKERDRSIKHINRRIGSEDLTIDAQDKMKEAIQNIIAKQEKRFINFFNRAGSISIKKHSLELIPGVGQKTMWSIVQERKLTPFISFEDLEERVGLSGIPQLLIKRIINELEGEERHFLFTRKKTN